MDPGMMAEIHEKARAAEALGMTVEQSYSNVDGQFFVVLQIKSGDNVIKGYPVPQDKEDVLAKSRAQVEMLKKQIATIEAEIIKIEDM